MRPSSSPSEPPGLFDGVLARGRVRTEVSDRAWLQAMLDVEAGIARAQARLGLLPTEHADAIAAACVADRYDLAELGAAAADAGNPVNPLVRALTAAVAGDAAGAVHRGATSQDVLDSAAMLVAHRALAPILDDLVGAAEAASTLTTEHRRTLLAARTLLQQALPTTFGLTAAGWLVALDGVTDRLTAIRTDRLAVQFGGAAGTLASLGDDGVAVAAELATVLGLAEPVLPWHTDRTRIAELAGALGTAAGVLGKIGRDVTLLAQTEVAEVIEGGAAAGGSSTLPHKRNPVAAVSTVAAAARAPGLVGSLLTAMPQEHQRAAGNWHAEWRPFRDLLETVGSAAAWLRDCLEHLRVDADRMRGNLGLTGGLLLTERVTAALAPTLGRLAAHDLVTEAATGGGSLADALAERTGLGKDEIDRLLDPGGFTGSADALIDRALAAHRKGRP